MSNKDDDLEEWVRKGLQKNIIYVNDEQWDELQRLLAEPPKEIPKLRKLFERVKNVRYHRTGEREQDQVASEDEEEGPATR